MIPSDENSSAAGPAPTPPGGPAEAAGAARELLLRPGKVSLGTPLMVGLLAGFLSLDAVSLAMPHVERSVPFVVGAVVAILCATLISALLRRGLPDRLRLSDTDVVLARGGRKLRRVDLARLQEVNELQTASGPLLLLGDHRETILVAAAQLARPADYVLLTSAVVERIRRLDPTGETAREAVRAGRTRIALAQTPVRVTLGLTAATVIGSFLGFRSELLLQGEAAVAEAIGAMSGPLLAAGEYFRLLSYAFVHAGQVHLFFNAIALLWLGAYLEKLIGWERMLLAFTAGTLGGAAGHLYYAGPLNLVGASGGVFGLIGLLAALAVVGRRGVPRWLLPRPEFWWINGTLSVVLPLQLPQISWMSHLGGALAGFLLGAILVRGISLPEPAERRLSVRPFGVLAAMALALGLAGGALHPSRGHARDAELVALALLDLPPREETFQRQAQLASELLFSPSSGAEAVAVAERLAESAVMGTQRREPAVLDTLAVARYRRGDVDEAIRIVEEALSLGPDAELRSFLERRLRELKTGELPFGGKE